MTHNATTVRLRKVLIVNRGEIAVRVIRALRERGIRSAVVHSTVDRGELPVLLADEAYPIGEASAAASYLRAADIVDLAQRIGADAVHPGYGFLSENAGFARMCRDRGIVFIGPTPEAIAAMGSKIESRRLAIEVGVPVVPGGDAPLPDLAAAQSAAAAMGYPVMLKAAAGGGGKGMRMVASAADLASAFRAARSEALASFGDDAVYLEKFLVRPRHVEIQVLGDQHGNVISLGERECSLQRRHQKVVEEAPSPVLTAELRRAMGEAAVKAAAAVSYVGAGTVEFLLDAESRFYFLEMNTRLQVEHPVTELVTGIDLVEAQLRIAEGEPLDPDWRGVEPRGHAIEVRVYAEDPYRGFAPSPGVITQLRLPNGPGVRNDFGVREGSRVTIHYDPMLGKLIVWGHDRAQALRRLGRALGELRVEGIRTTTPLYQALLRDADFVAGRLDIAMLDRKLEAGELAPGAVPDAAPAAAGQSAPAAGEAAPPIAAIAAAIEHFNRSGRHAAAAAANGGSGRGSGWRQQARRDGLRSGSWTW